MANTPTSTTRRLKGTEFASPNCKSIPAECKCVSGENIFEHAAAEQKKLEKTEYVTYHTQFLPIEGGKQPRILVVDDSPVDLRLLFEMMSGLGLNVSVAFSGRDGVDKALLNPPDLILMDVCMPGMDGFAACRLLKANPRTQWIPLIFLTASNEAAHRIQGLSIGGVDYIPKPFDATETLIRVNIHLNLSKQMRQPTHEPSSRGHGKSLQADALVGNSRNATKVQAAIAYLRANMAAPPSPEMLARLVGTNETSLNQAFNEHFGLPVFGWLREERMAQARSLLVNTDTTIARIGDYLGFSTASNFSKAFRERFGMSPRALRQSQHQLQHLERAQPSSDSSLIERAIERSA